MHNSATMTVAMGGGSCAPPPPLYQDDLTNSMTTAFELGAVFMPSLVYNIVNGWHIKGIIQQYKVGFVFANKKLTNSLEQPTNTSLT